MKKTIIIAAGGTGGHVFPAVCVAKELQIRGFDIIFATDKRGLKYLGDFKSSAIIQCINTSSRIKLYISLLINMLKSLFYLLKNKPRCVIGFGGYPCVPFVLAAQILKIKTIIHEQNAVIGKANKLLSKAATKIITSFEKVKNLNNSKKIIYIGNPTRYEDEYQNASSQNNKLFTILIFGGSQGASVFSNEILDLICEISKLKKLKIYQQARKVDITKIKKAYDFANIENTVSDFFENINELYKISDLVISRSGASSVFEIIGFKKPSILIPYKKSINGDQIENARFLEMRNATIVIDEENIQKELIISLIQNPQKREILSLNLDKLKLENITKKFAKIVIKTIYNENN